MKNIVVLADKLKSVPCGSVANSLVTSMSTNQTLTQIYLMLNSGLVFCCNNDINNFHIQCIFQLGDSVNLSWFDISYVIGTGALCCISHSGAIFEIKNDYLSSKKDGLGEEIGSIDGGICAAKWNPEQTCLVIATNNKTILCMSCDWEVLQEIPLASGGIGSFPSSISWKSDGEMFGISTMDIDDGLYKLRLFNKVFEYVATARNVVDGPASTMKGVGGACAFSTNGVYIAVAQQRVKGKNQA